MNNVVVAQAAAARLQGKKEEADAIAATVAAMEAAGISTYFFLLKFSADEYFASNYLCSGFFLNCHFCQKDASLVPFFPY